METFSGPTSLPMKSRASRVIASVCSMRVPSGATQTELELAGIHLRENLRAQPRPEEERRKSNAATRYAGTTTQRQRVVNLEQGR